MVGFGSLRESAEILSHPDHYPTCCPTLQLRPLMAAPGLFGPLRLRHAAPARPRLGRPSTLKRISAWRQKPAIKTMLNSIAISDSA